MSSEASLIRLAESASEAVVSVLEMFAPGQIISGDVAVLDPERGPLDGMPYPAVATSVAYVDGVTGGNVFVMTLDGARRLAAAMMGMSEPEDPEAAELSELELSAVSEAMNQMMATAAGAVSTVLGTEVEIGPPETQTFTSADGTAGAYPSAPHLVRSAFSVCGEPCRLVQLVPNAFVVRMGQALDEMASVPVSDAAASVAESAGEVAGAEPRGPRTPSLAGIPVRVWAELGRARMRSAEVVGLPPGAVVELDQAPDEPLDLYVNGRRFATGRLLVAEGGEWAVRIESVLDLTASAHTEPEMEVARWPESS